MRNILHRSRSRGAGAGREATLCFFIVPVLAYFFFFGGKEAKINMMMVWNVLPFCLSKWKSIFHISLLAVPPLHSLPSSHV